MIAYFVHNPQSGIDTIVLPEMSCAVAVDREKFEAFISPRPLFAKWSGDACTHVAPEGFGTVAATRDEDGDVCIVDDNLWRKRMDYHMTRAR